MKFNLLLVIIFYLLNYISDISSNLLCDNINFDINNNINNTKFNKCEKKSGYFDILISNTKLKNGLSQEYENQSYFQFLPKSNGFNCRRLNTVLNFNENSELCLRYYATIDFPGFFQLKFVNLENSNVFKKIKFSNSTKNWITHCEKISFAANNITVRNLKGFKIFKCVKFF